MIALLDTHTFIWMDSEPARVPASVLRYLNDPSYTVYLSVVSVWEILIKTMNGKLTLRTNIETVVADHLAHTPLQLLPVRYEHVLALAKLESHHKDPFDRLLISQAIFENAVLLTDDQYIRQYSVRTDW